MLKVALLVGATWLAISFLFCLLLTRGLDRRRAHPRRDEAREPFETLVPLPSWREALKDCPPEGDLCGPAGPAYR
jgi:hypothetical protein